jgi:hypothetical protein
MANRYLSFDGSGYVLVPDDAALNLGTGDFSICFWMFATGDSNLISKQETSYYLISISSGNIILVTRHADSGFLPSYASAPIKLNRWTHIVITRSGSTVNIYADGVSKTVTGSADAGNLDNTEDFYISEGGSYSGSLDDLRIYKGKALTQAEVERIYAGGCGKRYDSNDVSGDSSVVTFEFDEGTGETTTDSQAGLIGTLYGGVTWKSGGIPFHRALTDEFKKHSFYINRSSEAIQFRLGGNAGKVQIRDIKLVDPLIMDDR